MTTTLSDTEQQLQTERPGRLGPWMGIAFVVLFVAGFLLFNTPDDNASQTKWDAWWTSSSHRATALVAAYLMVLGTMAFVAFMWNLGQRFRARAGAPTTFGTLFVALALVSALIRAAIPGGKQFGSMAIPTGNYASQFDNIGQALLLVAGAISAGAFLVTASYWARRYGVLPNWLTVSGYVVGVLQLAAALFFPFALFPIWVLVASIVLIKRDSRTRNITDAPGESIAAGHFNTADGVASPL
jgi:drug/metabolite transporter (DMT)-like permease